MKKLALTFIAAFILGAIVTKIIPANLTNGTTILTVLKHDVGFSVIEKDGKVIFFEDEEGLDFYVLTVLDPIVNNE